VRQDTGKRRQAPIAIVTRGPPRTDVLSEELIHAPVWIVDEVGVFGGGDELGDAGTNCRAIESDDMKRIDVALSCYRFPSVQNIRGPCRNVILENPISRPGQGLSADGETMAYTVTQVAAMSGVSVRTLHFYDETALLKPAYTKANGYRIYEEPQLLRLQQILFYRQLGFELKQLKRVLGRRDFEKSAALESHRKVLEDKLGQTRTLIETIDKTIKHLKGKKKMNSEEMF